MPVRRVPGPAAANLARLTGEFQGLKAKVGFFESAKYEDGTPVAYIAAIQELGSPANNIPSRSFMRTTCIRETRAWANLVGVGAKSVLNNGTSPAAVMELLALRAAGDMQKTISQLWEPPLKEATVKARARRYKSRTITASLRKPLEDTGYMRDSLTGVVESPS